MEPSAWLVLTVLLSGGPMQLAWPAPSFERCEIARSYIPEPARFETRCTRERPAADWFGPELPVPTT